MSQAPAQVVVPPTPTKVAVYNIEKHTFTLPNGTVFEAHSGLGHDEDNPAGVADKMRGSTPPNLYKVTFREGLFHGVQALRLTPIGDDPMYGRAGLLIHSYMLRGLPGQSNGCIVLPQYLKVLLAFRAGEFDHVRVVAH